MKRLLTVLLVLPVLCIGVASSGDKESVGKSPVGKTAVAKSPEDAFENLIKAAKARDMQGFMANLTKDSRKVTTGSMVFAVVGMKQFAKFRDKDLDTKPVEQVIEEHKISEEKVLEVMKAAGAKKDPKEAIQATQQLADMVKDAPAFVADAFKAIEQIDKDQKNFLTALKDAKLKDVKIDGEAAKGEMEINGKTESIHFAREDDAWRIDLLPSILTAGKAAKEATKEETKEETKEAPK